jgi:hypothetical protein
MELLPKQHRPQAKKVEGRNRVAPQSICQDILAEKTPEFRD